MIMIKKILEENFEMENNEASKRWEELRKEVHTSVIKKYEQAIGDLKRSSLER